MASYEQRGKTWSVRYRDTNGTNRRKGGFPMLRDAKAWYRTYQTEREMGVMHDREMTLAMLADRFLAHHEASPGTITKLRCGLKHATDAMGSKTLMDLTRDDIMRWRKTLPTEALKHSSTRALKQALNYAVHDLKVLSTSPAARVKNPDPGPRNEFVPFKDWAEVAAIEAEMPEHYRGWATVIVGTGMRPQEWPKLRWEHVDLHAMVLRLPKSVVKHNTPARIIPLRKVVAEWFIANQASEGWVFPRRDGSELDIGKWRDRVWVPALERAGVTPRRPYDMRHTYATWALRAGMNTHALSRRMGTSLAMIDKTYGHLSHDSETHERMLMDAFDGISALPEVGVMV